MEWLDGWHHVDDPDDDSRGLGLVVKKHPDPRPTKIEWELVRKEDGHTLRIESDVDKGIPIAEDMIPCKVRYRYIWEDGVLGAWSTSIGAPRLRPEQDS